MPAAGAICRQFSKMRSLSLRLVEKQSPSSNVHCRSQDSDCRGAAHTPGSAQGGATGHRSTNASRHRAVNDVSVHSRLEEEVSTVGKISRCRISTESGCPSDDGASVTCDPKQCPDERFGAGFRRDRSTRHHRVIQINRR